MNVPGDRQGETAEWTCPFCSLLCDRFTVTSLPHGRLKLQGSDCARAAEGLEHHAACAAEAPPLLGQRVVTLEEAIAAAASRLGCAQLPLIGGLATDVAGARALYRLGVRLGAVADHAHGRALFHAARAQQDRGVYYTTLAEVRNRADLIVCLGTNPTEHYPEFFRRAGIGEDLVAQREVVFLGASVDAALQGRPGVTVQTLPQDDLFTTLAMLNALVARKRLPHAVPALQDLADRLHAARYAVIVWEPGRLNEHGSLLAEGVQRLVDTLNHVTRAASLALGGSKGGYTAQQVYTWLSGLPIRTHVSPLGLEYDPLRFDARQLLADGAVDALLWVDSFEPTPPPASAIPLVLLGHPATKVPEGDVVFIPVSTPGVGSYGHLFRTDGGVVVPLQPLREDGLPTVAQVVSRLMEALQ
ncbi:formylmethanofuran dehydrogenase [Azohydromonas australica]|uniref:formylmethanofuran dehydrogenase n=1 Tax=Azohydromonas australica TaxID=364039 RepID=UPI00041D0625|nr:formylmethanofuran dehydrogenase [Azohydromonas australica]